MRKKDLMWLVNVVSFVLLVILMATGLINWLLLPRGPGLAGGFRHLLREFHAWSGVAFCLTSAVHIGLHWAHVRANLKRTGLLR